jgi:hypothetical protein
MSKQVQREVSGTTSIPKAGDRLGISRVSAYKAAASGDIPTIRIGNRRLVPLAWLNKTLGIAE